LYAKVNSEAGSITFGPMDFEYIKALHIIFVVSWFSGLFYIVRLFIYHTEAEVKPNETRIILQNQFRLMEKRLWYIITWPAALLATFFGLWMIYQSPGYLNTPWMHVKLALTGLLWVYHLTNQVIFLRHQRNQISWNSVQLRLWNELATLWLVAIVFIVVIKNALDWIWATVGFFFVGILLFAAIKLYNRVRKS